VRARAFSLAAITVVATSSALFAACGSEAPPTNTTPVLRAPQHGPVPEPPEFEGDPSTPAKEAIGNYIFFDVRLSNSGHSTCNGCHLYLTSFQDNLITGVPDRSYPNDSPALPRNTPSFLNLVYAPVFRWDGSHTDLVEVLAFPFAEANMNLGADVPGAQKKLKERLTKDVPGYVKLFKDAYGQDITTLDPSEVWKLTGRALRAFVRKAVSRNAAFDKWNAGDDKAITDKQKKGFELFEGKGRCGTCHSGPFFTDFAFHNLSSSPPDATGKRADEGRYEVTHDAKDRGKFLTPTLRGVFASQPYFHDGTMVSLQSVMTFLSSADVTKDPLHDPLFDTPIALSEDEIDQIVDFLRTLRGEDVAGTIQPPPPNSP
jgi:cytochrome c peroxidase